MIIVTLLLYPGFGTGSMRAQTVAELPEYGAVVELKE